MTNDQAPDERLDSRVSVADNLLKRSKLLEEENIEGSLKLTNKIRAELRFLKKIKEGKIELKEDHLKSTNLTSLEALVGEIENCKYKNGILQTFHANPIKPDPFSKMKDKNIAVDIVSEKGAVWIKVIARNAKAILATWEGRGQFGEKSIISQAEQYLNTARQNPYNFVPPKVHFVFSQGVPAPVAKELESMGIVVKGKVIDTVDDDVCYPELYERLQNLSIKSETSNSTEGGEKVNLDITALLCMVSNLCHGHHGFEFGIPVLSSQAKEERQCRVLPKIDKFIEGKELYACETAIQSFKSIVQTVGGDKEKERAKELLKRIKIVDDQPSERTLRLKQSGKINKRAKIIFGTGDSLKAVTVTANTGFVRAAMQSGVRYSVFEHGARALTEIKEKKPKVCCQQE